MFIRQGNKVSWAGILVTWIFLLAGCVRIGPDYTPPKLRIPEEWKNGSTMGPYHKTLDTEALAGWWSTLNDPILSGLISRAVKSNLDLRQAQERVIEARARRDMEASGLFPTVNTSGSASLSRSSKASGSGAERESYNAGFDAGWEIDLFGKVRRSIEADEAEVGASEEDLRDVLVSLMAEVALSYIEARSFQNRIFVAKRNLEVQEESYRLTQWRFRAGLNGQLDVAQARANLESTRSQVPQLESGIEQSLNRLAVLLGENPGALHQELREPTPIPVPSIEIAIGLPAETLQRIPSVRSAERQLAAQTARVGAAIADLYPSLSLSGSIGLEALSFDGLFSLSSRFYRMASQVSWALFDAGRIRKNIKVQNALQEQALIGYERAVLSALEEVENALMAYAKEQERQGHLKEASIAASQASELAQIQYSSGLSDFQTVLDAQRSLYSLQDQLVVSEGTITSNLIKLYKAVGGGWRPMGAEANGKVK